MAMVASLVMRRPEQLGLRLFLGFQDSLITRRQKIMRTSVCIVTHQHGTDTPPETLLKY